MESNNVTIEPTAAGAGHPKDIAPLDEDGVTIEFVEVQHKVRVDMSKLTWGDALALQKARTDPDMTDDEREHLTTQMVSKITGEDADALPAVVVGKVLGAIAKRTGTATTAKN